MIHLFDQPWADAGFLCYCLDITHPTGTQWEGNIVRVGADVCVGWQRVDGKGRLCVSALHRWAVSGARWFRDKGLGGLIHALQLFDAALRIAEWTGAPYMIENPVSTVSTYWRPPDFTFDPCDFGGYLNPPGDAYTKKTCLWVGNGFTMPGRKPVEPVEGSRMHRLAPSRNRSALRSETPRGFAEAVFQANRWN